MISKQIIESSDKMKTAVLGTGAYGLALASLWHQTKKATDTIVMWTALESEWQEITEHHTRAKVLEGQHLPEDLMITMDIKKAIEDSDLIVLAVPSDIVRPVLDTVQPYLSKNSSFLFISKGLETNTNLLASEVYESFQLENEFGYLAGPTFAKELFSLPPAGVTLATTSSAVSSKVSALFKPTKIELEITEDIIGIEYCSVLKNVFAIMIGLITATYQTDSTSAYLLTKFYQKTKELLVLFGGSKASVSTFAGLGDILLTCHSENSRNYRYGRLIAKSREEAENFAKQFTVEGKASLGSLLALAKHKGLKVPFLEAVAAVLSGNLSMDSFLLYIKEN